jgi:hypothetical protein
VTTDTRERDEFANRSMDRLMATAKYGDQPDRGGEQFVISIPAKDRKRRRRGEHDRVSIAFTLANTEAVLAEMDMGAPCGICHQNPCVWNAGRLS